jgi:hypothetical protein
MAILDAAPRRVKQSKTCKRVNHRSLRRAVLPLVRPLDGVRPVGDGSAEALPIARRSAFPPSTGSSPQRLNQQRRCDNNQPDVDVEHKLRAFQALIDYPAQEDRSDGWQ